MLRTYALTRGTGTPLYEQLYRAIRQDILTGQLPGGTKLPSKRALAEHLSISKITVETAYAQLLAEGYLTARERSGYYVEQLAAVPPAAPQPAPSRAAPEPLPPTSRSVELFPFSVWARLMRSVILDEGVCPPPTGWHRAETLTVFGLAPGKVLPLPAVEDVLWSSLTLDAQPPAMTVAQALYPTDPARRDDAYSELCSKRSRGRAMVWALQQSGQTVCTVGAYAVANGQAYMACGQTAEPLRGKGIGGRLIVQMANALAAEGEHPVFLCAPERVHFYTRLGFAKLGEYVRFAAP